MKKLPDFFRYNFCNIKKVYYKNNFIIQDFKTLIGFFKKNKKIGGKINNLTIIPTTFCNGNCGFCANKFLKDPRKNMSFGIFKKSVDSWIEMGNNSVSLTPTIGEVLLDEEFFDKISYLNKRGVSCHFYTNGFLIDKYLDKLISSNIKEISIDIGDITPKYDAKVFGVSEKISKNKMNAIKKLIELNKKSIINLDFRPIRNFKEILRDIKKTDLWGHYLLKKFNMSYNTSYDNWGGLISQKNLLGFQTMKRAPRIKKFPCKKLYDLSILPDGKMRLCGCRIRDTFDDELVVGNINSIDLSNITSLPRFKNLIKSFNRGNIPEICKKCTFYEPLI